MIKYTPKQKERIDEAMRQLTSTLLAQLLDTRLVTIEQWNVEIAPRLSEVTKSIEDVTITARTYRQHPSTHGHD